MNYGSFIKGSEPSGRDEYCAPYTYLVHIHINMFSQFSSHISIILSQIVFEKQTKGMCKNQFQSEFDKEKDLLNRFRQVGSQEKEVEDHE